MILKRVTFFLNFYDTKGKSSWNCIRLRRKHGSEKSWNTENTFLSHRKIRSREDEKKKKIGISESLETCEYLFLTCQYERTYNCDRLLPLDIIYQLHGNGISSSRSIRHASNERVVRGNRAVASVYVKRIP